MPRENEKNASEKAGNSFWSTLGLREITKKNICEIKKAFKFKF